LQKVLYLDPNHYEALSYLALLAERKGDLINMQRYQERARKIFLAKKEEQSSKKG
jgi:hypothetical protein